MKESIKKHLSLGLAISVVSASVLFCSVLFCLVLLISRVNDYIVFSAATHEFNHLSINYLPRENRVAQLQTSALASKVNLCFEDGSIPSSSTSPFWLTSNSVATTNLVAAKLQGCLLDVLQPLMISDPHSASQIAGLAQRMGYSVPAGYLLIAHWVPGEPIPSL